MPAHDSQTEPPTALARPWHRLHLSTWLLILLLLGFFAIVEIPGTPPHRLMGWPFQSMEHGWPWVFLERWPDAYDADRIDKPPWLVPSCWKISDGFEWQRVLLRCLTADIFVALALVLVIAGFFEWRRRFRVRFFQFTLRELLLLVLLVAAACSWWRIHHNQRVREKEVMARFEKREFRPWWDGKYRGPEILEKTLGRDWLDDFHVVTQCLCSSLDEHQCEEVMSCIDDLPNLERVDFGSCGGNDSAVIAQWLSRMTALKALQSLDLSRSRLADSGMETISHMSELRELYISGTSITNRGVACLPSLPLLEQLYVNETNIDDGASDALGRLSNLTDLDVSSTKLTNKSVADLGKLSNLRRLDISCTKITPEGIQSLKSLLPGCKISAGDEPTPFDE
jgi:hypothetical protein